MVKKETEKEGRKMERKLWCRTQES